MITAEILDAMLGAGCTAEQIVAAVKASLMSRRDERDTDRDERRREAARLRQQRHREASSRVTSVTVTPPPAPPPPPSPDKEISPAPLLENNPYPLTPTTTPRVSSASAFDAFWVMFPNKVGKADARKKFEIALRKIDAETLMAALQRYVSKTDDRPWCNPATWLHQERWTDAPTARGSPGGRQPKGLEWFDAAIDWIDENERKRAEEGAGGNQDDAGSPEQRRIGYHR